MKIEKMGTGTIYLFAVLVLAAGTAIADNTIVNANIQNASLSQEADPCKEVAIGGTCTGGATYAGSGYSSGGLNPMYRYMVTPGGCTDNVCTGAGGTDSVIKKWANNSGTSANSKIVGALDLNDGVKNTTILVSIPPYYTDTDAAHWCTDMNYGGYRDWYLPSKNESNDVLYNNQGALGGFAASGYWSSMESATTHAWNQVFTDGSYSSNLKAAQRYVRCIRRY